MKHKLSRIFYNLKRYGIFKTFKKVINRILKLDQKDVKSEEELYEKWILQNEPDEVSLALQRKEKFEKNPNISIVVPMYNTSEKFFLELVNSLFSQTYENWELCLADRKCCSK